MKLANFVCVPLTLVPLVKVLCTTRPAPLVIARIYDRVVCIPFYLFFSKKFSHTRRGQTVAQWRLPLPDFCEPGNLYFLLKRGLNASYSSVVASRFVNLCSPFDFLKRYSRSGCHLSSQKYNQLSSGNCFYTGYSPRIIKQNNISRITEETCLQKHSYSTAKNPLHPE